MLVSWFAVAFASSPGEELPLKVPDEERWANVQYSATSAARTGAAVAVAGGLALGAGVGLLLTENEQLQPIGTVFTVTGSAAAAVGPLVLMGGSMRANKAMRRRGVIVPTAAGASAWTLFVVGVCFSPAAPELPEVVPVWFGGVLLLGELQLDANRRGQLASGTAPPKLTLGLAPTRQGVALGGTF